MYTTYIESTGDGDGPCWDDLRLHYHPKKALNRYDERDEVVVPFHLLHYRRYWYVLSSPGMLWRMDYV